MAAPIDVSNEIFSTDVHTNLENKGNNCHFIKGHYDYIHYGCNMFDDRGWGCGYRTLQTLCSWVKHQRTSTGQAAWEVPSILDIQQALVTMGDKPARFLNSREWIGSFEVCLCLDYFYDVPCKIIHINSGSELPQYLNEIAEHFKQFGSPIMMGGESDASSKGIFGVCLDRPALLILDPHYYGPTQSRNFLQQNGWVAWHPMEIFSHHTFYNLCLPQLKANMLT
ncbi:ufm1-specific protease 1-like [Dreissena polymorpha]|uniref:ufm1-specific protease 1-like n=1 Tax=Dreissena polymorpha TaxID=45954 RepID=UPI0022645653|nr:ufm1-specific protease 1-like [Dreissena polymorpha]